MTVAKSSKIGFIRKKHYETDRIQWLRQNEEHIRAEYCRRNFFFFLQTFWEEISEETPIWNWHIEYLCDELQILAERVAQGLPRQYDLVINIPPGTTKSTICSIMFPVWCWINWYWMKFITTSYSSSLSLEHAETSRDIVRSITFNNLFPDIRIRSDKDTKSNYKIVKYINKNNTKQGGNRYSTSVGGTLTGFHAHIIINDDPINPLKAVSTVELNNANRFLDQTLSTRKVDKAVTATIMIMQRLHQNDPTGHVLDKKKKNIKHICLPGELHTNPNILQPPELAEQYTDKLLDPIRMPLHVLKDMESDLGQYGYAGQVGQNPVPPGGGMFKVDKLQIVDELPNGKEMIDPIRYWDKAGTADGGAYTVGLLLRKFKTQYDEKYVVVDVCRGQWATNERESRMREVAENDGMRTRIYIEQEPGSGGKDSISASLENLSGFRAWADLPRGNKTFRADPASVRVNRGQVVLMRGPWNAEFISELAYFPFSTNKDQVDAFSGAMAKAMQKKRARVH